MCDLNINFSKGALQKRPSQSGFTLLEILIILVIISIVMTFAVLSVGDFGQSRQIRLAAEELDLLIGVAQEQAILEPAVLGINIQDKGYSFFEFILDDKTAEGKWQRLDRDEVLHYHSFPSNMKVTLKPYDLNSSLAASSESSQPQIIISPNGNITPFRIDMGKLNNKATYTLIGEYSGEINLRELS